MPVTAHATLNPRKSPVQARSAASVDAMLEATIQVLLAAGKERLTTTRVAERAGVSVGTLYQYFPNKSALLQAALKRHFDEVASAVDEVCAAQRGCPLQAMATALVDAYLAAKMSSPQTSVALYSVSSDVDGLKLAQEVSVRTHRAIAGMLGSAPDWGSADPGLVATVLQGAMAGVSRRLLESGAPERHFMVFRQELLALACAYLESCAQNAAIGR